MKFQKFILKKLFLFNESCRIFLLNTVNSVFLKNNCVNFTFPSRQIESNWLKMDMDILAPPSTVKFMTDLDRGMFSKVIKVPCVRVPNNNVQEIANMLKAYFLKMEKLKPIQVLSAEGVPITSKDKNIEAINRAEERIILLHPNLVKCWSDLPVQYLANSDIDENRFHYIEIELNYENWSADKLLKAILPVGDDDGFASYSHFGHIVHLNLRQELLPYKKIIGQILLDKLINCKTVVNKISNIENVYRNMEMELVCGVPDYHVTTKENGIQYEFDFSKVYWNPRLSTEHKRILNMIKHHDILFDVFAGVGPFVVPAALRKKCTVFANDLNPDSIKWLHHNVVKNKCQNYVDIFNRDGRLFLAEDAKQELLTHWSEPSQVNKNIHITMNLPSLAIEFIDVFCGLFREEWQNKEIKLGGLINNLHDYPTVHLYVFLKYLNYNSTSKRDDVRRLVESKLNTKLLDEDIIDIHFVRKVAPKKDMYCISFRLNKDILITPVQQENDNNFKGLNNVASNKRSSTDCAENGSTVKQSKVE